MHASLTRSANIRIIVVWTAALVASFVVIHPTPIVPSLCGAVLGLVAGLLQRRALILSRDALRATNTAMDVRRALATNAFGRGYLFFFWACAFAFLVIALAVEQFPFAAAPAYLAFALVRDAVTLPALPQLAGSASSTQTGPPTQPR